MQKLSNAEIFFKIWINSLKNFKKLPQNAFFHEVFSKITKHFLWNLLKCTTDKPDFVINFIFLLIQPWLTLKNYHCWPFFLTCSPQSLIFYSVFHCFTHVFLLFFQENLNYSSKNTRVWWRRFFWEIKKWNYQDLFEKFHNFLDRFRIFFFDGSSWEFSFLT